MSKRPKGSCPEQLSFVLSELKSAPVVRCEVTGVRSFNFDVVSFVDSGTLAVRRDAVRRVIKAGIFAAPIGSKQMRGGG